MTALPTSYFVPSAAKATSFVPCPRKKMFDSLRSRLTAWYVGVLSLVLLIFSVAVYVFVARSSYERLDAGLDSATETVASLLRRRSGTQKIPAMSVSETLQALQFPNQAIAVFNAEGQLLGDRPAADRTHVRLPPSASLSARSRTVYTLPERTSESDDGCRGIAQPLRIGNTNSYLIVVSQSLEPLTEQLDALLNILCTAVPVALGLTGLGGWFLARRSLAPVAAISERAQQIRVENLDQRLP